MRETTLSSQGLRPFYRTLAMSRRCGLSSPRKVDLS